MPELTRGGGLLELAAAFGLTDRRVWLRYDGNTSLSLMERPERTSRACIIPFDGSGRDAQSGEGLGLHHKVCHALRSVRQRLAAWRAPHHREALPDAVVIGTLGRPTLVIAMRATVVRTETAPPPISVFLERMVSHPLRPYCPRCSLRLEPWQADHRTEGTSIGDECRPYGTQIRWTPTDVLNQIQREVRCHYARYWERYREALRQRARGAPRPPTL